ELEMEVDDVLVLSAKTGKPKSSPIGRAPGLYRLKVRYRSLADAPARLQIGWSAPGFARELLPAWHLMHLVKEGSAAASLDVRGRLLAAGFGVARCHASALPSVADPPPGPSLADVSGRLGRDWLLRWLEAPAAVHADARMPSLFTPDRAGFIERWLVADYLL